MKIVKIGKFANFIPGVNSSRIKTSLENEKLELYDQASFVEDYEQLGFVTKQCIDLNQSDDLTLNEGDIVVSNALQMATIVSKNNAGKVITLNFTKVECDTKFINKGYFLFLFNSFKDVQRQKEKELQGTGPVLRIPARSLNQLTIPMVSMEEQQKIAAIYLEKLKIQNNLKNCSYLIEQVTNAILEDTFRGEKVNEKQD